MAKSIRVLLLACAVTVVAPLSLAETHVWISINGNFSDPASWNTGIGPSDWAISDNVLFDGQFQTPAVQGLDVSGVHVAAIVAQPTYLGNVGASSNPLRIIVDEFDFRGRGSLHFESIDDPETFNTANIDAPDSLAIVLSGSFDYLILREGFVEILPETVIGHGLMISWAYTKIGHGPSIPRTVNTFAYVDSGRNLDAGHEIITSGGTYFQRGTLHDCSKVVAAGGAFSYLADGPETPMAEFVSGTIYIKNEALRFRLGFALPDAYVYTGPYGNLASPSVFSLISYQEPLQNEFFDRTENYACPRSVTLEDFAAFQNAMTGP